MRAEISQRLRDPITWADASQLAKTVGAAVVALTPTTFGLNQGLNGASSGRGGLVSGGLRLFGGRGYAGRCKCGRRSYRGRGRASGEHCFDGRTDSGHPAEFARCPLQVGHALLTGTTQVPVER